MTKVQPGNAAQQGGAHMIPELGHFALILALCLAIIQAVVPLVGAHHLNRNAGWMALARPAAWGQFGLSGDRLWLF